MFDHAVQRTHQNVMNTAPHQNNHCQYRQQHHRQRPDSEVEGVVTVFHCVLVKLVVLRQIGVVDIFERVLIALRRLVKEGVDFALAQ
ncbi:hypothetical protein D3C80_1612030 [compost metagenome]